MSTSTQIATGPVEDSRLSFNQALLLALFSTLPLSASAQATVPTTALKDLKQLSIEELMELEVTSVSKRPEKLIEVPSSVQVITGDEVRRSGATSLPEALRLASNLQVAQIDARQWAISARGFNGSSANKLLVLMDGRTLYSPLHAAVFWDVQDTLLEDLDRIEIISGPGATQWGSNAVNGVINITTKSAAETPGLLITAGGGNALRLSGGVRYGGEAGAGVHYRVYGKHFERAASEFADGRPGENDWHMSQGGFRVDWAAVNDTLLTVQGDVYDGTIGQPANDDVEVKGGNLLARWTRTFSEKSSLNLQGYFDHTYRRIPGTFAEELDTFDIDFQHRFPLGERHDLVWGLGYRLIDDQQHNDYPLLAFLPANVRREGLSAFAQDTIALSPERLLLTLGAKAEHNPYTGLEIQPGVRLAWRTSPNHTLWAAVSRAVRTPSRIDGEFFAPRDPPFTLLQGNPDFLSEELLAWEVGYRVQPSPRLSIAGSLFYHDYDRLRSIERVNPATPFPLFLGNLQKGTSRGIELTVDYHPTDTWQLGAGYTHLHLHLRHRPESTASAPTYTDPEHQFFLRSSVDLPGNVEFDASYRLVARLPDARVPAYDQLDLRLGWRPRPFWEISITGQNLLRSQHGEFGAPASRQLVERNFYGKITWRY